MKTYILSIILSLVFTFLLGLIFIPILRKVKCGQPILKYVETHKEKSGTPTMGGLFFILPSVIIFIIFGGLKSKIATVSMTVGLAFMFVGFIDDFIKIKSKENQGLKAYQKILFQGGIALFTGIFTYYNGLTDFYLPFSTKTINLGFFAPFFVGFIFIAITNSVNLTDGLDGLAGSVSVPYLFFIAVLMLLQANNLTNNQNLNEEYQKTVLLTTSILGGVIGYLIFNVSKAKVFMGDTGSLSLGGFIGGISIFTANAFYIPIIGIMFVLSSISVIVQVLHFKRTGKRVFLMAPLHHHFQLKGYSEAKISYVYSVITFILGAISVLSYF